MKRIITLILTIAMVFSSTSAALASSVDYESELLNLTEVHIANGEWVEMNGAPPGVVFGNDSTTSGTYTSQSLIVSVAVNALITLVGGSIPAAIIEGAVVSVFGTGVGHINWVKKIAFGEDDNYYYVRTKGRLYWDSAHTQPLTDWYTIYSKRSKNSGTIIEPGLL